MKVMYNNPLIKKEPTWVPQAGSQEYFLSLRGQVFEVLYEGTRGPGKTDALIMDFCQHVGRGYGAAWRGILFRQTYKQLEDVVNKTKKWIPKIFPAARYNEAKYIWTFPDGEKLYLRQFQRESDYWNYHGHEYPWIGWEELCNWIDHVGYKRMMSCCRSTNPNMPRCYRATTNPYGPGHNWVKLRFRLPNSRYKLITDSLDEEGKIEPPRMVVYGYIQENKILLESDPEYIDKIRAAARNKAELMAWLYGSWDIVAGGMFDDVWNPKYHVLKPFNIPLSWRIDRSFDWGSSKPFSVGWWAESDGSDVQLSDGTWRSTVKGDLFRIKEWYGWRQGRPNEGLTLLATQIAKGIVERELLSGFHHRCKPGPADSSIYSAENGNCIGDDMELPVRLSDGKTYPGVSFTHADKRPGSRKTGWEKMRTMFKNAIPPESGVREYPGLFVFDNCDNFIRTIPVLPRSDKDMDDINTDTEDHIADETRYRVREIGMRVKSSRPVGLV
jgi:hypothetical protein